MQITANEVCCTIFMPFGYYFLVLALISDTKMRLKGRPEGRLLV